MGNTSKTLALILIIAISCVGLLTVKPAFAQSIPTPSVPTFTLQLVGPPIRVNTTYSLDSNTGQIVAKLGYTNPYSYVVLIIKNQPFDSSYGSLYFNVQIKNKNTPDENWTVFTYNGLPNPKQTIDSDYTNITISISMWDLADTQTYVQVQAMLGNFNYENGLFTGGYVFSGVTSPWSSTQTVNVPANTPLSPTPAPSSSTSPLTPTETPTSTAASTSLISFLLITNTISLIVIAFLLAVIIALLLYMRKRNRLTALNKTMFSIARAKSFALILILIMSVSSVSLMMIKPVSAQTIPTPSIPQFTLQTVYNFVQMTIQSQPIIPNGHDTADIFYNIRIKSHDSENWVSTTVPNPSQGIRGYIEEIGTSGSTVLQESFSSIDILLGLSDDFHQIDYQVEAINGYLNTTPAYVPPIGFDPNSTPVIVVNTSGWSSTQTVSISPYVPLSPIPAPSSAPTLSSTPTSTTTPTLTSFPSSDLLLITTVALVVIAFLLAVIIALLLYMRKRNRLLESNLKGLTKTNTSSTRA